MNLATKPTSAQWTVERVGLSEDGGNAYVLHDGNKRSAVFLAFAMIQLSGFDVVPLNSDDDIDLQMEDMAVELAEGVIKADTIIDWLRPRIQPM